MNASVQLGKFMRKAIIVLEFAIAGALLLGLAAYAAQGAAMMVGLAL